MVGHYQVPPSEYWKMTVKELELIHESRRSKMVGDMHEDEYLRLTKRREELERQGVKVL